MYTHKWYSVANNQMYMLKTSIPSSSSQPLPFSASYRKQALTTLYNSDPLLSCYSSMTFLKRPYTASTSLSEPSTYAWLVHDQPYKILEEQYLILTSLCKYLGKDIACVSN